MIDNLLKLGGRLLSIPSTKISQTSKIHGKQSGFDPDIIGARRLEKLNCAIWILSTQLSCAPDRRDKKILHKGVVGIALLELSRNGFRARNVAG